MRYRARQLDVGHALTTNFRLRNLDTAFLTHNAAMLEAFVLATQALVVFDRVQISWHRKARLVPA